MISFEEIYWRDPTRPVVRIVGKMTEEPCFGTPKPQQLYFKKSTGMIFYPGTVRVQRTFVGITFFSCHVFHAIFRKIKGTRFLLHKLRKALPLLLATVALMHIKRIVSAP